MLHLNKGDNDHLKTTYQSRNNDSDRDLTPEEIVEQFNNLLSQDFGVFQDEIQFLLDYFRQHDYNYEDIDNILFDPILKILNSQYADKTVLLLTKLLKKIIEKSNFVGTIDFIYSCGIFESLYHYRAYPPVLDLLSSIIYECRAAVSFCLNNCFINDLISYLHQPNTNLVCNAMYSLKDLHHQAAIVFKDDNPEFINFENLFMQCYTEICNQPLILPVGQDQSIDKIISTSLEVIGLLGRKNVKYSQVFLEQPEVSSFIESLPIDSSIFEYLIYSFYLILSNMEIYDQYNEDRKDNDVGSMIDEIMPMIVRNTLTDKIITQCLNLDFLSNNNNVKELFQVLAHLIRKNEIAYHTITDLSIVEILFCIYREAEIDFKGRTGLIEAICNLVYECEDYIPLIIDNGFIDVLEENIESMIKDIPFPIANALTSIVLYSEINQEYDIYKSYIYDNIIIYDALVSMKDDDSQRKKDYKYDTSVGFIITNLLIRNDNNKFTDEDLCLQ